MPSIRPYCASDLAQLQSIHAAQSFSYQFPDLTNPLFLTKLVLIEASEREVVGQQEREVAEQKKAPREEAPHGERILGAALLRLTAEAYLLLDPYTGSPRQRWNSLLHLHAAAEREATQRGLEDVHAWLPPPIAAKFGNRLTQLGWQRDDAWTPYCKRLR
jgi:hypothetical protein